MSLFPDSRDPSLLTFGVFQCCSCLRYNCCQLSLVLGQVAIGDMVFHGGQGKQPLKGAGRVFTTKPLHVLHWVPAYTEKTIENKKMANWCSTKIKQYLKRLELGGLGVDDSGTRHTFQLPCDFHWLTASYCAFQTIFGKPT